MGGLSVGLQVLKLLKGIITSLCQNMDIRMFTERMNHCTDNKMGLARLTFPWRETHQLLGMYMYVHTLCVCLCDCGRENWEV